ncbi:MAG: threonine synthase [Limnochordia bacterium]
MKYISTRGQGPAVTAAGAIRSGIAPDGGLYVPVEFPRWQDLTPLFPLNYGQRAVRLLADFLTDYSQGELWECVEGAYGNSFHHPQIAPVREIQPDLHILELWHGPTGAFKDLALQILPHLLTRAVAKTDGEYKTLILVATSGDTGKAALEGFRDVANTEIIVFYPAAGVSPMQERQMVTQEGDNVHVVAVEGNFDDAQRGVKSLFVDPRFQGELARMNIKTSSANSINWGRLVPQIVYYFSAYCDLVQGGTLSAGQKVDVVVPTGNFGNILAAYYAREMGLPINRLICASNANHVLVQFLMTGVYDRKRQFAKTISPSMDILISSNVERLLFSLTEQDQAQVREWMDQLESDGRYDVGQYLEKIRDIFWAHWASDEETMATIKEVFATTGYLLDPHTAVAKCVYDKYRQSGGEPYPTIIASTASPFKFNRSVATALLGPQDEDEFSLLKRLAEYTQWPIPPFLADLDRKPIRHRTVCRPQAMGETVVRLLGS